MARVRGRALISHGCEICSVASRTASSAQIFAAEFGFKHFTIDYRDLLRFEPEAVLVEVPHHVQDEIVLWALRAGLHVFIGGCLAMSTSTGMKIAQLSESSGVVIETGFEARYKEVWRSAKEQLQQGAIGEIVSVKSVAIYDADPTSWYYQERESGGMILTHMTYAFLNPLRWLFGTPVAVSAFSNRKRHVQSQHVRHEMCSANLLFPGNIICNMFAGYGQVPPVDAWSIDVLGTEGFMKLVPGDLEAGHLYLYQGTQPEVSPGKRQDFGNNHAFDKQAEAFLADIQGEHRRLNPAWDSLVDLQVVERIVESAERQFDLCDAILVDDGIS